MTDHPITPSPELVEEWIEIAKPEPWKRPPDPNVLCTLAAQWGADQELEACCAELESIPSPLGIPFGKMAGNALHAARRPKPPSLKVQALRGLEGLAARLEEAGLTADLAVLYSALQQLDD